MNWSTLRTIFITAAIVCIFVLIPLAVRLVRHFNRRLSDWAESKTKAEILQYLALSYLFFSISDVWVSGALLSRQISHDAIIQVGNFFLGLSFALWAVTERISQGLAASPSGNNAASTSSPAIKAGDSRGRFAMSTHTAASLGKTSSIDEQARRTLQDELSELEYSLTEMQEEATSLPYKSLYAQLLLGIILLCICIYAIAFPYLPVSATYTLPTNAPALALLIGIIVFYWMAVVIKKLRLLHYILRKAKRAQQRSGAVLHRGKELLQ